MDQGDRRDGARLLEPSALARLKNLQLRARGAVEGALTGLHRSPHHGSSVEFAEHKEYSAGDEIRHIDWKVFGKSDKYVVKRYEQETNLRAMLVVDASASMLYGSEAAVRSKWEYATELSAALAYLLLRQQDSVGLTVAGETVAHYAPPRTRSSHLMHLCELLVGAEPTRGERTNLLGAIQHVCDVFTRRGLVFVLSDFLERDQAWFRLLRQLRGRRQQIHLLHLVDPWEMSFPFDDMTIFRSLESTSELLAEPRAMRDAYLKEFERFRQGLRGAAIEERMEYRLVRTDVPVDATLSSMIGGTPVAGADGV